MPGRILILCLYRVLPDDHLATRVFESKSWIVTITAKCLCSSTLLAALLCATICSVCAEDSPSPENPTPQKNQTDSWTVPTWFPQLLGLQLVSGVYQYAP